ncbi:unnamed protein product [marine sediment metagenome]|uniref:Carboxypeptidase regulatory-like domain-containing protein n=1 Tax=marine sediment metagenome TaxID=412755 RepID=X1NS38_9ZZZZ
MAEEMKISPVVVIAGGLGLALAGALVVYAIARAAPGVPPEPPPGLANLYGIITDAETGEPIAGAQGTVYQDHDTETETYDFTTNFSGYYQILDMLVEVDVTQMVVYANGYKDHTDEDLPIVEGNNELNIEMEVA